MKKLSIYLLTLFIVHCSLFITPPPASAKVMWQEKGTITIPTGETVDDDLFIASENVVIDGTVTGSIFAGAGSITISGDVGGDIIAGSGNLNLSKVTVGGNVIAGAGQITIDQASKINGSLIAGAGNLNNSASIGRNAMIGAGSIYLNNKVGKEARLGGGTIELGPLTVVSGNLTYALGEEQGNYVQDPAAKIGGSVSQYTPPAVKKPSYHQTQSFNRGWLFISFLGSLVVGFLLLKLFPKTITAITHQITKSPLPSLGTGFLIVIAAFPVFLVLALTVIGLPLVGLLIPILVIEITLAKLVSSYALGRFVATQFSWSKMGAYAVFGIGLAIFYFLRAIPFVGFLVSCIFTWAGLGAIWRYTRTLQKNL